MSTFTALLVTTNFCLPSGDLIGADGHCPDGSRPVVEEMRVLTGENCASPADCGDITSLLVITRDGKELLRVPASAIPADTLRRLMQAVSTTFTRP